MESNEKKPQRQGIIKKISQGEAMIMKILNFGNFSHVLHDFNRGIKIALSGEMLKQYDLKEGEIVGYSHEQKAEGEGCELKIEIISGYSLN